jgi:uncharacterized protein YcnI
VRRAALVLALAAGLVTAAPATAHVDVLPREVAQGEAIELTVRVPSERDLATTRVRVEIPPQITVYSFGPPPPGWRVLPVRGPDGRFRTAVFSGGSIPPARYADFTMLGTPFESGTAVWKVRQTYADGVVKRWTGPPEKPGDQSAETGPGDPGPAAAVTVLEPGATVGGSATASSGDDGGDSGVAVWLGVIAIGISGLAVLGVGFLWSTRPATLPTDDEDAQG